MRRLILALAILMACSAEAQQQASGATLFQGYTGTSFSYGFYGRNQAAGTGTALRDGYGNYGVVGAAVPTGGSIGTSVGTLGVAAFGGANIGVVGRANAFKADAINIGGAFWGVNQSSGTPSGISVGIYVSMDELPAAGALAGQLETAAAIFDNRAIVAPVLLARINGQTVLSVPADGQLQLHTQGTKPACDAAHRGAFWYESGAAGVADTLEACRKDAADIYAWTTI